MQKNILESLRNELKQIKKEGKVDNINVEQLDVEEREIHEIKNRKMKKSTLKKGLVLGATAIALMTVPVMPVQVVPAGTIIQAQAAKKDKKKPTIKFSGSSKIKATKGKSVKIPKTTAKDNKDGNVTKKIKVAVKKGSKSYSSIAKKVKANKAVKFTSAGTYVITYTVKDKAGNKATKKRYVTVKAATTDKTTQQPYVHVPEKTEVPATTETPKTTEAPATTEAPKTTESPATTEAPKTTEAPTTTEAPANTRKVTVGEYTYNLSSENFDISQSGLIKNGSTIRYSNSYDALYFSKESGLQNDGKFLQYIGGITAASGGKILTDQVVIYDYAIRADDAAYDQIQKVYIAVKVNDTVTIYDTIDVIFKRYQETENFTDVTDHTVLSHTPAVLADKKVDIWANSLSTNNKKLVLNK